MWNHLKRLFEQPIALKNAYLLFFSLLISELLLSIAIIYAVQYIQIQHQLQVKLKHIQEDIKFTNNIWNVTAYNTDPQLIGRYPLYVITADGVILDRRAPIHGYLDTSDYRQLLKYQQIQTITTIAGQTRRIYAKPILSKGKTIGVIAVAYFNPKSQLLNSIDKKLVTTLDYIASKIAITKGMIDTHTISERKIPYNIAFTIVDNYNTLLEKNANSNNINRVASYIDPSYIKRQFSSPEERILQDNKTGELFLTETIIIKDKRYVPLALITVGSSLNETMYLVHQFLLFDIVAILLILIISLLIILFKKRQHSNKKKNSSSTIVFDETRGMLIIDSHEITIPYATNQYYLLQALFTKPYRRWSLKELLIRFGEDTNEARQRKAYDAMAKINKKVYPFLHRKLISTQNKTYQLNLFVDQN